MCICVKLTRFRSGMFTLDSGLRITGVYKGGLKPTDFERMCLDLELL